MYVWMLCSTEADMNLKVQEIKKYIVLLFSWQQESTCKQWILDSFLWFSSDEYVWKQYILNIVSYMYIAIPSFYKTDILK